MTAHVVLGLDHHPVGLGLWAGRDIRDATPEIQWRGFGAWFFLPE
jgi:hypothetical protein